METDPTFMVYPADLDSLPDDVNELIARLDILLRSQDYHQLQVNFCSGDRELPKVVVVVKIPNDDG